MVTIHNVEYDHKSTLRNLLELYKYKNCMVAIRCLICTIGE